MELISKLVKSSGQRFTAQKKQVYSALKKNPQTILELLKAASKNNKSINKATVYRIVSSFVKIGIAKEISLGKEARYELSNSDHHHHLVCEECGSIEDVELNEEHILTEAQHKSTFKIKNHLLEFFGICNKCQ